MEALRSQSSFFAMLIRLDRAGCNPSLCVHTKKLQMVRLMTEHAPSRVPVWYWLIAIVGLLWFLMDFSAFYMRVFGGESMLASMPEPQQELYRGMPSWVNIVFALEVFGGLLGCIGLLLKKRWAMWLLVLSLIGTLCQTCYVYFMSDAINVMGALAVVMPLVAIAIVCLLLWLAKTAVSRGWHS
jgi:hypothetical protein